MTEYVSNRLHFLTNAKTILYHIKSKYPDDRGPSQFSLNSIKRTPVDLSGPLDPAVVELSIMNLDLPALDGNIRQMALDNVLSGRVAKASGIAIDEKIDHLRNKLAGIDNAAESAAALTKLETAVDNYHAIGFFSQYDWRMTHWGTIEDICSIDEATFELPTKCIEFQTAWTPPIAGLQLLSNAFPSVKFRLEYRIGNTSWTEFEFFPFPPFGY